MSDKRYLGNIITDNPTAPSSDLANSSAKGVWSLEEQLAYQKAGLWPVPGNFPLDIDDVFSTYLFKANNSTQTITNGIDLDGEGGMVWLKSRTNSYHPGIYDTVRGANKVIYPSVPNAEASQSGHLSSFNSDGFTLGSSENSNFSSGNSASWTFRKAPKFFTCVQYTGDGTNGRQIAHDLGGTVGSIFVKKTNASREWAVYHRGVGATHYGVLNNTDQFYDQVTLWNDTEPTSTDFTVGYNNSVNTNGDTYVAYLFAHNDGDGDFGPDGDADIIKCGSYTGGGSTDVSVDLGFEPQWLLIKTASRANEWMLVDTMRGAAVEGEEALLLANSSSAEFTGSNNVNITPTGFDLVSSDSRFNDTNHTYIYMAIRRGPLAVPEDATEVFSSDFRTSNLPEFKSGFVADFALRHYRPGGDHRVVTRLLGKTNLVTNSTAAEASYDPDGEMDFMNGWGGNAGASTSTMAHTWKRAPGYFDAVAYTGNGTSAGAGGQIVNHNLGVVPEMMWVKKRSNENPKEWVVYYGDQTKYMSLNSTSAEISGGVSGDTYAVWNPAVPFTNTTVGFGGYNNVNSINQPFIAYLFASAPGVSKVGSYTGNGTSQTIDCGFTSGARFVLIKRTDDTADWIVYDTARGIVTGNEPHLYLNRTDAEVSNDLIDPDSSGFIIDSYFADWNASGGNYIFYAIA